MKILLAEDEKALSDAECAVLSHFGFETIPVYDGEAAWDAARSGSYDCIVLDIMMPKADGISVLKKIRESGDVTPVMMLTAKTETEDCITGLDAGADDYLTKPFAMGELVARIRSLTRRAGEFTQKELSVGDVTLNLEESEMAAESTVRLGSKEAKLMRFLMMNEGKELSTEEILRRVWDDEPGISAEIVWMYISFLREKLTAIGATTEICGEKDGAFTLRGGC